MCGTKNNNKFKNVWAVKIRGLKEKARKAPRQ